MRQTFRGFYSDENRIEEVLKSDDTRIILDTNVLLNLYNYHDQTREKFFETLKKLEDKLWLPYHVVLEYQRRRVAVLRREKNKFHVLKKTADSCLEDLGKVRDQALFKRIPEVKTITEEYRERLKPILEEYKDKIEELNKSQLAAPKNDPIRGVITELFNARDGSAPSEEWVKDLVAEGEKRFEAKVPPGYRDEKKDQAEQAEFHYAGINYLNKLGDLIIWKQLIEMAKEASNQVKNIVFVTDDGKEDWWHIDNSSKKEKVGARAELREELCEKGGVKHFSMYDSADFLKIASKVVGVVVDANSISDVKTRVLEEGKRTKITIDQLGVFGGERLEYSPPIAENGFILSFLGDGPLHRLARKQTIDWLLELEGVKAVMDANLTEEEFVEISMMIRESILGWTGKYTVEDLVEYVYDTVEIFGSKDVHRGESF